jgi:hypothetical protein
VQELLLCVHDVFNDHAVPLHIPLQWHFSSDTQRTTHKYCNAGVSLCGIQPRVLYLVVLLLADVAAFMGPASRLPSAGIKNLNVAVSKRKGILVARQDKIKTGSVLGLTCSTNEVGRVHVLVMSSSSCKLASASTCF